MLCLPLIANLCDFYVEKNIINRHFLSTLVGMIDLNEDSSLFHDLYPYVLQMTSFPNGVDVEFKTCQKLFIHAAFIVKKILTCLKIMLKIKMQLLDNFWNFI